MNGLRNSYTSGNALNSKFRKGLFGDEIFLNVEGHWLVYSFFFITRIKTFIKPPVWIDRQLESPIPVQIKM